MGNKKDPLSSKIPNIIWFQLLFYLVIMMVYYVRIQLPILKTLGFNLSKAKMLIHFQITIYFIALILLAIEGGSQCFSRICFTITGALFCRFINLYCRLGLLHTSLCDMRIGVGSGDKLWLRFRLHRVKKINKYWPVLFILTNPELLCAFLYVYVCRCVT